MICYLNGQILPKAQATVPVEDRGFIFGDGVYEVWRVVNGRLFESERHFARLSRGLEELRITPPADSQPERFQEIADQLLSQNGLTEGEGTLYLEITRGVAPRAHAFPTTPTMPTMFAMVNRFTPPDELRATGATAVMVPDMRWLRCDLKTIQLLPNVLAKQAAAEKNAMEALMHRDGVVTEGSHASVIFVLDGVIRTHPLNNLILPGITRAVVLELARGLGMRVSEEPILLTDVAKLDEAFLAGTTADVMPIVRIDDTVIGTGKPGPIAMRLFKELRAHIDATCATVSA